MAANGRCQIAIDINDGKKCKKCKKCIFRVPKVLRRQNAEAYTPDVVSIGPFHYREKRGKKDFQLMKGVKTSYLKEILAGMNNITLEELTAKVIELSDQKNEGGFEERARNSYAEPLDHIPPKDFIKMMIVDGCFLIQFFRKCNSCNLRAFDDPVFNMDCMCHFIFHDILLLENQLPWFVIHSLYGLTLNMYSDEVSLSVVILQAFSKLPSLKHSCTTYMDQNLSINCHCDTSVLHILDLVRASIVTPSLETKAREIAAKHQGEEHHEASVLQNSSATALSDADIKFKAVKDKESIIDIEFKKGWLRNGTLLIPQLTVGMSSETLFRNLIALEQCYHGYLNMITSYAIVMDNLISSKEDLDLLCKKEVICNLLSEENGCKFFSDLYKDITHKEFYYVDLCHTVNKRYKLRRYTWLAALKIEKFSNPWKVLAFAIGIFILALTTWNQTNNTVMKLNK